MGWCQACRKVGCFGERHGTVQARSFFFEQTVAPEECYRNTCLVLRLKSGHACDVISAVAEFMVDVAGVEARPYV